MPYRSIVDVHLILERTDGQVLLAERSGGYGHGQLNVPGGKLEDAEDVRAAAIREAREELGIEVDAEHVRFISVVHHRNPVGETRVGFFFATSSWTGTPINTEPDKCAGLRWVDPHNPPAATIDYTRAGLAAYVEHDTFRLDGWTGHGDDTITIREDPALIGAAHPGA